ncbi:helix-turn-helix domain-containing protein [Rhizobium sp. DBTS2]|uniref:Helix-turn-helix domain-containing protein n=1 Tax=Mycoplana rhizolycopersici TaxID=2746702 RepID=A0ABX2QDJ4_9HYPH|nr:helix-turn-helix domain-containing protein [Rhizobium rhizolycopersici]
MTTPMLLTPQVAAERLGISTRQLRDLTDEGQLRWINIGLGRKRPTRRYTEADLEAFIEERAAKCRSTREQDKRLIPTTSSYAVVDFRAILAQKTAARRSGSKPSGKKKPS